MYEKLQCLLHSLFPRKVDPMPIVSRYFVHPPLLSTQNVSHVRGGVVFYKPSPSNMLILVGFGRDCLNFLRTVVNRPSVLLVSIMLTSDFPFLFATVCWDPRTLG